MGSAVCAHRNGGSKRLSGRIEYFCRGCVVSANHEHHPVVEERRRRIRTAAGKRTCRRKRLGAGVIEFCSRQVRSAIVPTGDEYLSVRQQGGKLLSRRDHGLALACDRAEPGRFVLSSS